MTLAQNHKMPIIAGLCIIEDDKASQDAGMTLEVAQELKRQLVSSDLGQHVEFYFKASFDKANRSSIEGFRGPGLKEGLRILSNVKAKTGLQLLTDFHESSQADAVTDVVDFLQVPAFLCRQTDMIASAAMACLEKGKKLNIKKGQFLAPWDAKNIAEKVRSVETRHVELGGKAPAKDWFYVTERGVSFGYNTLVVDMTAFKVIQGFGVPVIYDATHSVQQPGAGSGGKSTGGKRENIEVLARAAVAAGANGVFLECHPNPAVAKSDGPNAFYLKNVGDFVRQLLEIRKVVQGQRNFSSL